MPLDSGVVCLSFAAVDLWHLGYPEQAPQRSYEARTLAQDLSHPHTPAFAQAFAVAFHQFRREAWESRMQAEAAVALSSEHGFPFFPVGHHPTWVGAH